MTNPDAQPRFQLGRRRLIGVGALGTGALLVGGALWRVFSGPGDSTPGASGGVLSRRQYAAVEALALAYFPTGNGFGIDARDADVAGYLDRYLGLLDPTGRRLIQALIGAFDQGTLLAGRLRPARAMDTAEVQAYLRGWEESGLAVRRSLALALRSLIAQAYFAHPGVQQALSSQPPCFARGLSLVMPQEVQG
jgi:hypothetical protein